MMKLLGVVVTGIYPSISSSPKSRKMQSPEFRRVLVLRANLHSQPSTLERPLTN